MILQMCSMIIKLNWWDCY